MTASQPMSTAPPASAPPVCGSCGYDTTGLISLTCPECGADLRIAGITRGRRTNTGAELAGSLAALFVAWMICGLVMMAVVQSLVPGRRTVQQSVRLGSPRSGSYSAVDVAASGSGLKGERPAVRAEIQLVPLTAGATPPAPLPVSADTTAAGVLAWMAGAGIDTTDPLVRDEAQAVAMAALRALRSGRHVNPVGFSGGRSRTSLMGRSNTPFGSVNTTSGSGYAGRSTLPRTVFAVAWLAVLVLAVRFLWRATRPRAAV